MISYRQGFLRDGSKLHSNSCNRGMSTLHIWSDLRPGVNPQKMNEAVTC